MIKIGQEGMIGWERSTKILSNYDKDGDKVYDCLEIDLFIGDKFRVQIKLINEVPDHKYKWNPAISRLITLLEREVTENFVDDIFTKSISTILLEIQYLQVSRECWKNNVYQGRVAYIDLLSLLDVIPRILSIRRVKDHIKEGINSYMEELINNFIENA